MGEGGDGTRSAPLEMKWETRVALRPAADRVFIDQPAAGDRRERLAAAAARRPVRVGGRYLEESAAERGETRARAASQAFGSSSCQPKDVAKRGRDFRSSPSCRRRHRSGPAALLLVLPYRHPHSHYIHPAQHSLYDVCRYTLISIHLPY
jgi:hypothetical protein